MVCGSCVKIEVPDRLPERNELALQSVELASGFGFREAEGERCEIFFHSAEDPI